MIRILLAFLIAILCHVILLVTDPGMVLKKADKIKKPAITVSMSYKKKPEPPPVKKTAKEIIKKKEEKVVEKIKDPVSVKRVKKIPEPVREQVKSREEIEEKEEVENNEAALNEEFDEAANSVEETASTVVTEAMPLYKVNPQPDYPRMAKKRKFEGTVILSVHVNKEGIVDNLWIFESSGYNMLDNAAMKAVKNWTFMPGRRGNDPIDMWVEVPVRFEIE